MIYDVLIVGNGGAGLTTAIELKRKGIDVVVLSKTNATSSQTVQAQGGINAVMNNSKIDTVQNHINDTYKSSHDIGDIEAISMVCNNADETILWLDSLGVAFSRDDNNNIAQRKMAGSSNARTCYSSDYTGLKIMHTLFDTALKLGIKFIDDHLLLSIIKEYEIVKGITSLNLLNSEVVQILAKKVIIATGGYSGVYYNHNTNSSATTSDGIIAAYNIGCHIKNMEFVQFHPSALKGKYILISESARAEGGHLILKDGTRFVDELLPRDVVSREIFKQIQIGNEVFLDLRHLGYEKIMHLIPQEYKLCMTFKNLKMDKDLIPIIPAVHYSMGGIKINKEGQTNIKNLYAVGECSATGVHGANRLGGNSLLEIITYGINIAKHIDINNIEVLDKQYKIFHEDKEYIKKIYLNNSDIEFEEFRDKFGSLMYHNVGLFRDENNLTQALNKINKYPIDDFYLNNKSKVYNTNLQELLEFKNMIETSKLIIESALFREESRGAHTRIDFAEEKNCSAKSTVMYNNGKFNIGYENEN